MAAVPLLWPGGPERLKAIWVGAISLFLLVGISKMMMGRDAKKSVATARRRLVSVLKNRSPVTAEQVFDDCCVRDFPSVEEALAELVEEGIVQQTKRWITDDKGNKYVIRLFALSTFPANGK